MKGANLKGANLEGEKLKGVSLKGADLKGANLKGLNPKNVKGAKKTTKVSQKDLVRMCKRKAKAQFRKCSKGSSGGNAGGNFLAHQGCARQRKKDMLVCNSPR